MGTLNKIDTRKGRRIQIVGELKSFSLEWPYMPPKMLRPNFSPRNENQARARSRIKRDFQDNTIYRIREQNPDPMNRVTIKYIARHSKKPMDPDNLVASMKFALDCLTIEGIITDDGPNYVTIDPPEFIKVPHNHLQGITMQVTEQS